MTNVIAVDLSDRFWSKVKIRSNDECWLWDGAQDGTDGYGVWWYTSTRHRAAHREAFRLTRGFLTPGLNVLHSCDVRLCVNPYHLFEGTQADNIKDAMSKGRNPHGSLHGNAKLSEEIVVEIILLASMGLSGATIGRIYDISTSTACRVINRETWKHVLCPT